MGVDGVSWEALVSFCRGCDRPGVEVAMLQGLDEARAEADACSDEMSREVCCQLLGVR